MVFPMFTPCVCACRLMAVHNIRMIEIIVFFMLKIVYQVYRSNFTKVMHIIRMSKLF